MPRDEDSSEPKGCIRGNTKIGPALEVTKCRLQGKYGVEIRIKSMNRDNSHSWVRISHDLNKLVTNLNNKDQDDNEQKTSEMQFEDNTLRLNASDFASRSKAKAKPQGRNFASSSTRTILIGERIWTDIEPQEYSLSDYSVSEKLIKLLRHGSLPREDDGAIEFWRIKVFLRIHKMIVIIGLMKSERAAWQEEEEARKYISIVLILQEKFFISEPFKVIQDALVLILHYRTMCELRTVSSSTFIILDVQSIYIPSSIQD